MIVDDIWKICIDEARKAYEADDVPIGAVLVQNGKIIAVGHNTRQKDCNVLGHAEINVILEASKVLKRWILTDCDLYVTLKPCSMCEAVIKQARISNVFYLADKLSEKKEYSRTNFCKNNEFTNSNYEQTYLKMMADFFASKR